MVGRSSVERIVVAAAAAAVAVVVVPSLAATWVKWHHSACPAIVAVGVVVSFAVVVVDRHPTRSMNYSPL